MTSSFRSHRFGRFLTCCLFLAAVDFCTPAHGWAASSSKNSGHEPVLVQADQMTRDDKTKIITAIGHVEVAQGGQVLHADKIVYNEETDIVRATGHVAILQPTGEVLFTNEAELTSDMKDGFINKVGILFPDNSRLAAQDAERYEGRYLIADRGVYTSCTLCAENPDAPPLWQVKGARITHDSETKDVIYRDATLEFDGVPVFYTPYFSHPDPTVKRREGLLTPYGGYSQYIGTFVRTPYYFDIAPTDDATLTPTFSEIDKAQIAGEWRHRSETGKMQWDASVTEADLLDENGTDKGQRMRGAVFGNTLFDLDDVWRAGTDIEMTSDKSYLQRYKISSEQALVNRGYAEGFEGRDYAVGNMYYFQNLIQGAQPAQPFVAPDMSFSALGEPGQTLGGRWSMDGGLLMTARSNNVDIVNQGPDTRRLAMDAGWQRQMVSSTGFLTTISSEARADGYWADNVPETSPDGSTTTFDRTEKLRPFAQTDLTVRYPMGRRGDDYQQIVEPIGMFSVAPSMKAYNNLPNEDSQDVEFDETNLFSTNRFSGIDRIEGGTRAAYGVRQTLIGDNGVKIEALGGQIYQFQPDPAFPDESGLNDKFSDYVARLGFTPSSWFDMSYGARISKDNGRLERQEGESSIGTPIFRPFINYLSVVQADPLTSTRNVEEGTIGFNSRFAKYWTITASQQQAFQPDPGPRTSTFGFAYGDECFQAGLSGEYDNTNRQDLQSGLTVMFHFYLKNIGGFQTDSVTNTQFMTPSLAQQQNSVQTGALP
jgi:LPS-assembly protein